MPKSRGRRQRKHGSTKQSTQRGRPKFGSVQELALLRARLPLMQETDNAEARGDAVGALELISADMRRRGDENFWRPHRVERLMQLAAFGPMLPRWATSRWILAQACQTLDASSRPRSRRAFEIAEEMQVGDSFAAMTREKQLDRRMAMMDHDWVFRQVYLYELGGLQHFVRRVAAPDLLTGADHINAWAAAAMGAFRLVGESAQALVWHDLRTGDDVESINVGAASLLAPGECAIGRLVAVEDGSMFESAPLLVSDDVAQCVAADPPSWIATLRSGCRDGADQELLTIIGDHDFRLLTDVPGFVQGLVSIRAVEQAEKRRLTPDTFPHAEEVAVRLVRAALDGRLRDTPLAISPWPSVAASLLDANVLGSLRERATSGDAIKLLRLAGELGGPAAEVCRVAADDIAAAA